MHMVTRGSATVLLAMALAGCVDHTSQATGLDGSDRAAARQQTVFSHFSGGGPAVGLALVAEGLTSPVYLTEIPDGTGRLAIVDQIGLIRVILPDGSLQEAPYLDVRDRLTELSAGFDERGLLGLAFHPEFSSNGRLFVYYSADLQAGAPAGFDHTARISEFRAPAGAAAADAGTERVVLEVHQPQFNHNGGTIVFGPADGYLYISLGDGGGANDVGTGHVDDWYERNEGGNAQNIEENLLGAILRIDVDGGMPYDVPVDNPFVGGDGRDEIWAYGLRNPYRMSFDPRAPHVLLAGDAGQLMAEEVNRIVRGGNYGWNVKEGLYCFNAEENLMPFDDCPDVVAAGADAGASLLPPVIAYPNAANPFVTGLGLTVIGGHIYRGSDLPAFRGRYIFADFSERIFISVPRIGLPPADAGLWAFQELRFPRRPAGAFGQMIKGFGQDLDGEVYVLGSSVTGPTGTTGTVHRFTRVGG